MKNFNLKDYIDDFKTPPFSLLYSFEDPNDQLDTLNNLIPECIEQHALLVTTKFKHPLANWMIQLDIADLQKRTTIAFQYTILQLKKTDQNLQISEINKNQKSKKSLLQKNIFFLKLQRNMESNTQYP